MPRFLRRWVVVALIAFSAGVESAAAQSPPPVSPPAEAPLDPLGRSTPKGTVLGFLNAARRGEDAVASQYLDTRLSDGSAQRLARQLFVVLDARLPARLSQLSDDPTGSRADPLRPDRNHVGDVRSANGEVPILLDRVQRGAPAPIWLFSATTLDRVPALYDEVMADQRNLLLPGFLRSTRIGGARLGEWLAVLLGFPLLYFATVLLNKLLTPLVGLTWRLTTGRAPQTGRNALPVPARLLILVVAGRWVLSILPLSLLVRQFWNNIASLIAIGGIVWLLVLLNGEVEQYVRRKVPRWNQTAAVSLLRVLRRLVDVAVIFVGFLATLRHFGVDPTPALAGLGVGGIAVALAAQKTLENMIAGASLIFDQAVRVGDALKVGETIGTVDHIGLRSTRIRTLDRTVVSIPNGQIANASLETLSARDKFWFHHTVGLRYETTPEQLRLVVEAIRLMLEEHTAVDRTSVRVRFFRLGAFSLDVELFAYLFARDLDAFLEMQEQLLFRVTEIIGKAGTEIAFPSQTMYLSSAGSAPPPGPLGLPTAPLGNAASRRSHDRGIGAPG